jgi:hypothetical protein
MKEIPLRNKKGEVRAYALVDDEDYERLGQYKWSLDGRGYVQRNTRLNDKKTVVTLHREVLGLQRGDSRPVDHINRVRTDNRRENLRIVTRAYNAQNTKGHRDGSSRYPGVSWDWSKMKWAVRALVGDKNHYVGRYDDELTAARAYDDFCAEHQPGHIRLFHQ